MKTIIITLLLVAASSARAQTAPWVSYTPMTPPSRGSVSIPDPYSSYDFEFDELTRRHYQNQYENQVVESKVVSSNAVSMTTGTAYAIQVKKERRRNGSYSLTCIGIKMGNRWVSCGSGLADVQLLYQQAKTQEDRSAMLELMEVASFVFEYNNTIYLIPKSD